MFGLPKEIVGNVEKKASYFSKVYKNCLKMKDEKDVPHVIYFSTGLIEEAETQEFGLRKANCDEDNTFGKRVAVNKPSQLP